MKEIVGLAAVILTIIGHFPYIVDILKKKTKPHIFTWVVWSLVTILAFAGQWQKGAGPGSWVTGITGFITIFITVLALRHGSKDIRVIDKICFIAALISIIPWYLTSDPTLSIIIITFIDVFAILPTVRKTLIDPTSETLFTYVLNIFRHGLSVVALANYNVATYLYPTALLIMNIVMTFIILRPKIREETHVKIKGEAFSAK